jgi:TPR repeat protein
MGITSLNAGNLDAAERLFTRAIQEGDPYGWNNLGVIHHRRNQIDQAIAYYTVAARYGIPTAQQNLVILGQPVPPVDLSVMSARSDGGVLLQALLMGAASYQQGQNSVLTQPRPAPAAPVNCVTKQNLMTKAWETVCR